MIYYINISLFMSNAFLTGLSSVFRLSIHHGVLVMYVIVIEKNGHANCLIELVEILNLGRIPQNSADFGGTRQCGKPAKQHRLKSFQLTNQCSITYVNFPSHAHGVHDYCEHAHC